MSGRFSVRTNLLICAVAVLGDWTAVGIGVAAQHRKFIRQDGYRFTNERGATDYHVPAEVSSSEVNKEEVLPPTEDGNEAHSPILNPYQAQSSTAVEKDDVEKLESEVATRYNFDKRLPSSYKLKYGGLGKRRLSSNSLRYSGLGKRLSGKERAAENEAQELKLGNGKHLFETAYFFLAKPYPASKNSDDGDDFLAPPETMYDTPADQSEIQLRAVRHPRSVILSSAVKHTGLGKRKLKMQ